MSEGTTDYGRLEFTVRRTLLKELAAEAAVAVPSREGSLKVHSCFQVTLAPGLLQLAATDGELTVFASTQAVITQDSGVIFLPARRLQAIVAEAPDGDITVAVRGNFASISAGGPGWDLKLPGPRGYSELLDPDRVDFASVGREQLLGALRIVRHAVCKDPGRPQYAQVRIAKDGDQMYAWGADSSQFSRAPVPGFPFETSIPAGMLDDLVKLLGSPEETVDVGEAGEGGGVLVFRVGHVILASLRMAAEFPNMQESALDPTRDNTDLLEVDKDELLQAVRRAAINASSATSAMALIANSDGETGTLTVQARDDDGNRAEETIPATWAGSRRLLAVHWRFLAAMAAAHPAASCVFRLGEDKGRKRSMVRLEDTGSGVIGVIPQMAPASVGY